MGLPAVVVVFVISLSASLAQEAPYAEDLQFVRELRSHGYTDLAREYLERLAKSAPPQLKKELPLERALTEMEAANDEPDSGKRIALYAQARTQFESYLKANSQHTRAGEARFEIARATTLQGKAQLSRAMLEEDLATRVAEGKKARATLVTAHNQLKQLPSSPQIDLAMALNLLDQSETYLNSGSDKDLTESIKPIQDARKTLEKLAEGDSTNKITWQARAWVGRCIEKLDEPRKAVEKYYSITEATGPAVQDGKRLARYFLLLARKKLKDAPNTKEPINTYLINQATTWLQEYPSYARSPEGYGVQYLLAETLLAESDNTKLEERTRSAMVARARKYLTSIERNENEFTDRARRLKLDAMARQGLFKQPISKLASFEDCYVRAQYEQQQLAEDVKKAQGSKSNEEAARKARMQAIIEALQAGIKKPDALAKESRTELNNARALLTYYLLNEGKLREAIETGGTFAKNDPGAGPASTAAIYALVAHGKLLSQRERGSDAHSLKDDKEYQTDKAHMLALAHLMKQRWPKERAGDFARHEIALQLLREEKLSEAIAELDAITSAYPAYIRTHFLLARAALQQAAQDRDRGDPERYRQRALAALASLPAPEATADVETQHDYVQAKLVLAGELLKDKEYKQVDELVTAVLPRLGTYRLSDEKTKDAEEHRKFSDGLTQLSLYSTALQADSDFKAARYQEVTRRLDPIVDQFNADKLPQLKESGFAPAVLALDLKANVQLNKLDRARPAIKALQSLQAEKGDKNADNTTAVLAQLVNLISQQIEDLRKKGNKDELQKAHAAFTTLLNEVVGGQKTPTPKLAYLLARCYAGMDEHKKAVNLLKTFASSTEVASDVPLQHAIQLLLVQEYRQVKESEKASELLKEILTGKDGKPGWGAKSLDAQKLRILLMEDREEYASAALLCDTFIKQMVRRLDDNKIKEQYFEFYYHLVYCIFKHGQQLDNADRKAKAIRDAAQRIVALEKAQNGLGNDESKKRFDELLEKESDLREQYKALKESK
jgi:hypothetical protein